MALVLGVDSSTQSTKVELRDLESGALVATGRSPHPPTAPPRSEQDPEAWWSALVDACAEARTAASSAAGRTVDPADVVAISVAGQQHGMVILDAADSVVRPAKLWNDTESAAEAAAMVAALGPATWAERVGSVPVAAFTVTKLAWLAAHEPESFAALRTVLLPHDWLTFRLSGRVATDRGDASGTGYRSVRGGWLPVLLDEVVGPSPDDDWAAALPDVLGPTEAAGLLRPGAARALGLGGPRTVVGPGTGDNMAAALGIAMTVGDVAISIGTSGTVYAVSDRAVVDPTGAVAGFADATDRHLPLVCTLNATLVTEAVASWLGVGIAELDALAAAAPAGGGGTTLVPHLAGERTPNRPDATGTWAGLRTSTTRDHLARAAFEGVVGGLLDGLDALRRAGVDTPGRIALVGGGARSATYPAVLAHLTGRPIALPDGDEHVALGACVQAAAVATSTDPLDVARAWGVGAGRTVDPASRPGDDDPAAIRSRYAAARA